MVKFDPVQAWIDGVAYSHSESKGTEDVYKRMLGRFCQFVGKTPEQVLEEYENTDDRRFRRKYAQYLKALISERTRQGYAVNSIRSEVQAVRSFFKYNDLPLGHVPVGRKRITFHNRDMAKDEITRVLEVSRPRDKAFFCMMAQTGLRPETLCNLRREHIEPEFNKGIIPCKIEVPEEIAKGEFGAYFSFMGEESVKYLKAYLAIRSNVGPEDYLFAAHGTDKKANPKSLSRIFRASVDRLKETGKIEFKDRQFDKPAEIRMYNLRKFFRNQAGHTGVEYVNFWMGHRADYKAPHIPASDAHYVSREDIEFQRQLYKEKAMPYLRLETATPSETEQTIMELRTENQMLRSQMTKVREELGAAKRGMELLSDGEVLEALHKVRKDSKYFHEIVEVLRDPDKMEFFKQMMSDSEEWKDVLVIRENLPVLMEAVKLLKKKELGKVIERE